MLKYSLQRSVRLTELEQRVFETVRGAIQHHGLKTTVRVAGGWVRDKVSLLSLSVSLSRSLFLCCGSSSHASHLVLPLLLRPPPFLAPPLPPFSPIFDSAPPASLLLFFVLLSLSLCLCVCVCVRARVW